MVRMRVLQFRLKTVLVLTTVIGVLLGIHTCPPPTGPLLMKAAGGIALFVPVLVAVYFADWFERRP